MIIIVGVSLRHVHRPPRQLVSGTIKKRTPRHRHHNTALVELDRLRSLGWASIIEIELLLRALD